MSSETPGGTAPEDSVSESESVEERPRMRFTLRGMLVATTVVAVLVAPAGWLGGIYVASLITSLVMLSVVSYALWKGSTIGAFFACAIGILPIGPAMAGTMVSPVVFVQAIGTAALVLLTIALHERPTIRVAICALAMAIPYGWGIYEGYKTRSFLLAARAEYPLVSVEHRLKPAIAKSPPVQTPRLNQLDQNYSEYQRGMYREKVLSRLHNDAVLRFSTAVGFGATRMDSYLFPSQASYLVADPSDQTLLPTSLALPQSSDIRDFASAMHESSVSAFMDASRMGMVQSASETAGFEPHAFTRLPGTTESEDSEAAVRHISLRRLELLGYAHHAEPVVYVSDKLPNMETVAETPTRPPNAFEAASLAKLVAGEDLIIDDAQDTSAVTQMLGAVRAATSCTTCHEVAPGALLGAFSYELAMLGEENRAASDGE